MRKEAFANTSVHLDSQPQSAIDPVALLLHAGHLEAEAESEVGQLSRELALSVELAIVVHSEREGACKLEVLTELQGSLDVGERSKG